MTPIWIVALVALLFGCAAYLVLQLSASLCANIVPFDDGPRPGQPPTVALVAGATILGGAIGIRSLPLPELGIFALLAVSLVACWYSDVRCGIVLDYFTLGPLAIVVAVGLLGHDFAPLIAALVVALPFGLAALFSKGRGMGWGDVKLVALGAAVLGLQTSVLAFAAACLVAVAIAAIRRRRSEPMAFVPYLAASIAVALAFPILP